ncbi:MAG: peptidylprolyl isomerase [Ignavibacteria bacterium]|nr:peptidylprolyl isomerase [Ignavibacteria bacterium]
MGTFERIRKISPYALIAFAVIFVAFMVASDADISNIIRQSQDIRTAEIARINGEKILYKDFEERVREQIEQQRNQNPEQPLDIDETQVRKSLWTEIFEETLLKQEASKIGITVTDDEILDVLLDNPPDYLRKPFTDSAGNFQRQTYLEIITNPDIIYRRLPNTVPQEEKRRIVEQFKKDLINIEKFLRKEKLMNGIRTFVSIASSFVSPSYAVEKYIYENSVADARVIFFDIKDVPDEKVNVSDEEIKRYYEENKQFFPDKPKRKLKYVIFKIQPSQQDSQNTFKNVNKFYTELEKLTDIEERSKLFQRKFSEHNGEISEFKLAKDLPPQLAPYITTIPVGQVVGPIQTNDGTYFIRLEEIRKGENEVVKASHILVEFGNNKDSALKVAKDLLKRAKAGEDFATLAKKYSQDKGSAVNGGDLGYFGKGMMVKPFEDACYNAKVGEIVGPVESQFGYHIIWVQDKKSEEYKYSFIKFIPQVSRNTERIINRNAKMLKEKVKDGIPFDSAAKEFNVQVRTTDFFERTKPVLGSNYLTSLAFDGKVGDVIEPFELKNQGIIVAQIVDERKGGFVPLEDLKERIKFTLMKRKKLDILEKKAKEAYKKIKPLGSLVNVRQFDSTLNYQELLDIKNNGFIPGIGQDWAFTSKVFMLPLNTISEPFRGERGYYIIEVFRKVQPDETSIKNDSRKTLQTIVTNWRQSAYLMWFNKIKDNADFKDYRSKYYREY